MYLLKSLQNYFREWLNECVLREQRWKQSPYCASNHIKHVGHMHLFQVL